MRWKEDGFLDSLQMSQSSFTIHVRPLGRIDESNADFGVDGRAIIFWRCREGQGRLKDSIWIIWMQTRVRSKTSVWPSIRRRKAQRRGRLRSRLCNLLYLHSFSFFCLHFSSINIHVTDMYTFFTTQKRCLQLVNHSYPRSESFLAHRGSPTTSLLSSCENVTTKSVFQ